MSNLYLIGDLHGNFRALEEWLERFAKTGDIMCQLGDFGLGFVHDKKVDSLATKFSEAGCRLLIHAGNHDEPSYFKENRKFKDSVECLPPTTFRTINNKGFLFLGGAISVDRYERIEGRSWWRDEVFVLEEEYLKKLRGVDYILSHTCPDFAKPVVSHKGGIVDYYSQFDKTLVADLEAEGALMKKAWDIVSENNKVKGFYYGHFHCSKREEFYGCLFRCLDINEMMML